MTTQPQKLRVLFVPESVHWVTGTIAKNIARFNPWIEATIASGVVLDDVFSKRPELMHNFDLVHFTCQNASKEWLPRFRNLVPCVTSHHHVDDWSKFEHDLQGDAIVVGSPEWSEDLRRRGADMSRVFCVPYGVDAELFRPSTQGRKTARQELGFDDDTSVVGFFGKSSSDNLGRKGVDIFSSGVQELSRHIKLAVLIIGPGWQELSESLAASGVRCVWIPFIEDLKELVPMYQALDFYWVTARVEGGPVTLLEAMSTEVCCLTTPVGIAREIVKDNENALMLPFNDSESFVTRTKSLARKSNELRRLGQNARKTILEEMHVGVTATAIREVYSRAFAIFAERTHQLAPINVSAIWEAASPGTNENPYEDDSAPLNGFPGSLKKRARMLERLTFAEPLLTDSRHCRVAAKMIMGEWLANPASLLPARAFLRSCLPNRLVSFIVALKNQPPRKTLRT